MNLISTFLLSIIQECPGVSVLLYPDTDKKTIPMIRGGCNPAGEGSLRLISIAISDRARAARRTCASSSALLCDPPEASTQSEIGSRL